MMPDCMSRPECANGASPHGSRSEFNSSAVAQVTDMGEGNARRWETVT